ncbi:opacity family porin [Rodentibacter sp. Ppn85]|uniref:opacity family porin n=1 Tax=Rodentibacter sp. Ppn85 TaxID=1908525 RepID=UPI0009845C05|nr:opacity family porin [Rodentibacter sp. Ppn85]OOF66235.1 porin [Rodentibacter sp. Ppn85]
MKKSLLALAIGTLVVASSASANWYVQGDLGYSKVKSSLGDLGDFSKSKFTPSLAVGYKHGDWRFALDYTNYGKIEESYANRYEVSTEKLKIYGLGLSAIYDIDVNSAFKPYVGVRLSQNFFDAKHDSSSTMNGVTTRENISNKENKFGYGVLAGVSYNFTPNWAVNGGIEYNRLGKFDDVKINQYGAKVGIRYEF